MQGKIGIKSLLLSIALMCTCLCAQSQNELRVHGSVKESETFKKLAEVLVQVERDGKPFDSYTTGGNAKFEFELDLNFKYVIKFSKGGFVSKNVEINTKYIPEEDQDGGFNVPIDMTLFEKVDGFNESILDQPIGIMAYDANKDDIDWDNEYTKQIQQKIAAEFQRLENSANEDELKQKQFDELMIKGSDNVTKAKYDRAIDNYKAALDIFPDDSKAQTKLAEAQKLFDEQNSAAENQKKYDRAMQLGSSAMKSEDYTLARTKFEEAKTLMPSKKEPKDKLRELDGLEKDAGAQKRFDDFISAGDSDMSSEEYQSALDNYKSARDVFPADKDVKKKINEAQAKLDELLDSQNAEAAAEARYKGFIDSADGAFDSEKYERSIDYYEQALEVKNNDSYATSRIEEAREKIEELKKDEEAATATAEANADEEKYDKLVKEADELYTSEDLENSRLKYSEALTVIPDKKYPRQRIKFIDDLLAEKVKNDAETAKKEELANKENERLAQLELQRQQKKAQEEENQRKLEEEQAELERLANEREQSKIDAEKRRRTLTSNIDPNKERQAEEYYAQERERIETEARTGMEKFKKDHYLSISDKNEQHKFEARDAAEDIEGVKEDQKNQIAKGQNYQEDKNNEFQRKEEEIISRNKELEDSADDRRKDYEYETNELKKRQKELIDDTSEREESSNELKQKLNEIDKTQKGYIQQGEINRKDNEYKIAETKEELVDMKSDGETTRQKSLDKLNSDKEEIEQIAKENISLQNDRIEIQRDQAEKLKLSQKEMAAEKEEDRKVNVEEVNYQKESRDELLQNKESQAEIERSMARDKAFDASRGEPKDFDDYKVVPGTEDLAEGVTERSYEINNGKKLVIERTLKIGNKVVTYSKVIDQHGIYYFKDGRSITKATWQRETLNLAD